MRARGQGLGFGTTLGGLDKSDEVGGGSYEHGPGDDNDLNRLPLQSNLQRQAGLGEI